MAMLCCVSRKAAAGSDEVDSSKLSRMFRGYGSQDADDAFRKLDEAVSSVNALAGSFNGFSARNYYPIPFEDAQQEVPLEPCGVCGRKFNLLSLGKHERICERTAAKKRKPFDSAKQRIQGTELAEFLPKLRATASSSSGVHSHHHHHPHHQDQQPAPGHHHSLGRRYNSTGAGSGSRGSEDRTLPRSRTSTAWKQTHDEFLRAIRAARGDSSTAQHQYTSHHNGQGQLSNGQQQHQPQSLSGGHHHQQQQQQQQHQQQQQRPTTLSLQVTSQGAPTRPNEKGQCPTCLRQFGVKSYERHVTFCKERSTRVPASPLLGNSLVAKERLEARMRYRAPALKNRRQTNREKYSPGNYHRTLSSQRSPTKENSASASLASSTTSLHSHPPQQSHHQQPQQQQQQQQQQQKDGNNPKLPVLKRTLHSSKESLVSSASSGPLKSRPIDRSNSKSDSTESLNPPALRQLFASRRLLLLNEVLPSKIMKTTSSKSGLKSLIKSPVQYSLKSAQSYDAKAQPKKLDKPEDEDDEEHSSEDIAWRKRCDEVPEYTIDKEEEPVLSQVTLPGSISDGAKSAREESDNETIKNDSDDEDKRSYSLDKTFTMDDVTDLEADPPLLEVQATIEVSTYQEIPLAPEVSSDRPMMYVNTRICTNISEEEEGPQSSESGTIKSPSNCQINPETPVEKLAQPPILPNSPRKKIVARPRKTRSLPNVAEVKKAQKERQEEILIEDPKDRGDMVTKVDKTTSIAELKPNNKQETEQPSEEKKPTTRCQTYRKEESNTSNLPEPEPLEDPFLEDKPEKKRSRLGTPRKEETSTKFPMIPQAQNSEMTLDYYRNSAANDFSDVGSIGTVDSPIIEYDSDFLFETESNASELIKEIDSSNYMCWPPCYGPYGMSSYSSASQMDFCVNGMSRLDLIMGKPQTDSRMHRSYGKRSNRGSNGSLDTRSSSTVEAAEISIPRISEPHFEKEICTITRLDSIGTEEEFGLPSIAGSRNHRTEYHREKLVKARPAQQLLEQKKKQQQLCPTLRRTLHRDKRSLLRRSFERLPRCDWNSYIRRHPDFSMILRNRIGLGQEYNPFLLAEQQLNDLFSDTSDQSSNDGSCPPSQKAAPNSPIQPRSPSFAKYPSSQGSTSPQSVTSSQQQQQQQKPPQQRASVIAPPTAFDDLMCGLSSSECTDHSEPPSQHHVLGRRLFIDSSQALGGGDYAPVGRANRVEPPKPPERKTPFSLHNSVNNKFALSNHQSNNNNNTNNNNNNNYKNSCLNGSQSSLNSEPTDALMKRSNSLFDELLSSFEEDCSISTGGHTTSTNTTTLPSLMSLMRNDPALTLFSSTPGGGIGTMNGRASNGLASRIQCSDDDADLSSPESLKGKECVPKLSADSAYSSLNRKYSAHGRSSNDVSGGNAVSSKFSKLSRFCHECGCKFPDQAKFCCECGVKRLTI